MSRRERLCSHSGQLSTLKMLSKCLVAGLYEGIEQDATRSFRCTRVLGSDFGLHYGVLNMYFPFPSNRTFLRTPILELAERFQSCNGWYLERAFTQWCYQQPLRSCLPIPFELLRGLNLKVHKQFMYSSGASSAVHSKV